MMNPHHLIPLTGLLPAWFRTPLLPVAVGKEWHAIMPFWLASLALAGVVGIAPEDGVTPLALLALILANAAIGATVVGHEFTHRTLGMLLAQPMTRASLWRRKRRVTAAALLTATAPVCLRLVTGSYERGVEPWIIVLVALGTVLSGLWVAPWLTQLTRSTLAGTVFTATLPAFFAALGQLVSLLLGALGDWGQPLGDQVGVGLFFLLLVAQWPASAYLGQRNFLTLEAFETRGQELSLPGWPRSRSTGTEATAKGGGWSWWILRKELRLQQVSVLVAGLFTALWVVVAVVRFFRPSLSLDIMVMSLPIYAGFIALLVGALACAEERHFGTLEWQLTLPVSAARQWRWKAGVVLALALALGVALPTALGFLTPFDDLRFGVLATYWRDVPVVTLPVTILLAGTALYASSICQTTIRALLASVLIALMLALCLGASTGTWTTEGRLSGLDSATRTEPIPARYLWAVVAVLMGFTLALLGLANYRTVEQRVSRVLAHLALLGLYPVIGGVLYVAIGLALGSWNQPPTPESPADAHLLPPPASTTAATPASGDPRGQPAMDIRLLKRFGLVPKGMTVVGDQGTGPSASASTYANPTNVPAMDIRMLERYGLVPTRANIAGQEGRGSAPGTFTNAPAR